MYCTHCGQMINNPSAGACPSCGTPVPGRAYDPMAYAVTDAIERSKSYMLHAVLALALYFLFWPLGLILNIVFLVMASDTQSRIGTSPEGKGCLWALLIFMLLIPGLFFLLMFLPFLALPFLDPTFMNMIFE